MELVSVHSTEEQQFVEGLAGLTSFWIGLRRDPMSPANWVWSDGTPRDYNNWGSGEPNSGGTEDCVEMKDYAGQLEWNDTGCSNLKTFVCVQT